MRYFAILLKNLNSDTNSVLGMAVQIVTEAAVSATTMYASMKLITATTNHNTSSDGGTY